MNPPSPPLARLRTPGFAGYSVSWSPFFERRLAVASSANYGLVGNGRLHILSIAPNSTPLNPNLVVEKVFDTQDGLYDVAFSEAHENQLVTASGDGSIKLWDCTLQEHPIRNWAEHNREVFCVDWNNIKKDVFASSSWDASVRVWHPERPTSLMTITAHTGCVYACAFSPHNPDLLATACADGHLRLFDLRQGSGTQAVVTVPVGGEVLCLDWNKYRPMTIATGSTDRVIKTWDLRNGFNKPAGGIAAPVELGTPIAAILGHEYAVRKVAYSPHSPSMLASASYDMTSRIWDTDAAALQGGGTQAGGAMMGGVGGGTSLRKIHDAHTEFVVGVSWSLFQEGLVASCAWDSEVHLWGVH
ncbi:related to PEX7 - peroxisomal import protein, peroxin [Melanopsichium pennsylvanicum]|uniref:Peroxin-7 n=2 Tax=Melanopsichium pennsylvanicum TaxID=63383 RepID=A0AAJ4XQI5_9BASI|nr:related to PEX7-peroxisomal import protein, peroxin [Melanopsichium pennsylvanicum 4]SNX86081.1 related to PEX7 - peroxisomal import protein, peroxin [Melanopsichium pennsylvanicum]